MALNPQMTNLAANAEADAVARLLDNGWIDIMDSTGAGQPATADTAITTQVKLANLRIGNPSAPSSSGGIATFNAITQDGSAAATGTATWFRCYKADHTTPVMDGSVGTSGANMNIDSVAIQIGAVVQCSSFTYTAKKS